MGSLYRPMPLAAAGLAMLIQTALADPYSPQVGHRHTGFTLPSIQDGKPVSLSAYRGKKVLLIQFASW